METSRIHRTQGGGITEMKTAIAESAMEALIKKACGIESGSANSKKNKVATITKAQVKEIATLKMPDLNAKTIESAMSMIEGTCRSMGVTVIE